MLQTGKVGRNDPCPCDSGKKYKRCCLGMEAGRKPVFATLGDLERETSRGECSVPPQWMSACSARIVKAHTVPHSSLKRIADNGHVMSFVPNVTNFKQHGSAVPPQRRGIRMASTFTGFCGKHDDAVFSPLEKVNFSGTREQCFLVAYRALARELYLKSVNARFFSELLKNIGELEWMNTRGVAEELAPFLVGTSYGLKDLASHKMEYDQVLLHHDHCNVKAYVIEFTNSPPVMCSGGIFPEHTFNGEPLQILGLGLERLSAIYFSSFADSADGFVVFAWLDDGHDYCERLVESLKQLPDEKLGGC